MKKSTLLIVLMHLVYWVSPLIRLFYYPRGGGLDNNIAIGLANVATFTSVIVFYLFYFFLFPRFLYRPQLLKFMAWSVLTITAVSLVGMVVVVIMAKYYYMPRLIYSVVGGAGGYSVMVLTRALTAAVGACVIKGFITWFTEIRYKEQLERQNVATNLELLKAKINPHFLFNTLNNIDVLIEKDAESASVYLKKLSDILRFTLYESPSDTIQLKKELEYITKYIDLQKIRTSNPDFVMFDFSRADGNKHIPPMLFTPFIENAFKYSTNKKINNGIEIIVATTANTIAFNCSNIYDKNEQITAEGGLGLTIMKDRLQLLYPGNHHLEITKTTERFTVALTITLYDN